MAEKCAVKLPFDDALYLSDYLKRKDISHTVNPTAYCLFHGDLEAVVRCDDTPNRAVYQMIDRWMTAREKGLKICPFCGGIPVIDRYSVTTDEADEIITWTSYFVECFDCGCKTAPGVTEEDVIEVWNKRFNVYEEDSGD